MKSARVTELEMLEIDGRRCADAASEEMETQRDSFETGMIKNPEDMYAGGGRGNMKPHKVARKGQLYDTIR